MAPQFSVLEVSHNIISSCCAVVAHYDISQMLTLFSVDFHCLSYDLSVLAGIWFLFLAAGYSFTPQAAATCSN